MWFKDISYLELLWPICSVQPNDLCNFGKGHMPEEHFCEILLKKYDISYLELWPPLYLVEQNYLCYIGRGHHEEHFCELILNLDQCFRSMLLCRHCKLNQGLIN